MNRNSWKNKNCQEWTKERFEFKSKKGKNEKSFREKFSLKNNNNNNKVMLLMLPGYLLLIMIKQA